MSAWARSWCTWVRAATPVIHLLSPEGRAILPSIDSASFNVTNGRPEREPR
jgi:hypothetical protein